jgi:hypothetical protein
MNVLSGSGAIYIGCDSNNATLQPTIDPSTYLWTSSTISSVVVQVNPTTDPKACSPPCNYYIGIASSELNRSVSYTVLAKGNASSSPSPLIVGESVLDSVAAFQSTLYSMAFDLTSPSMSISLLTVTGTGVSL